MNRKLWENLTALIGVQALSYIAPLLTLPLLARVLGPTNWGKLAFAEAYASYLSLVIEYGFGLSATREVAQNSQNIRLHSELMSGVLTAQAFLSAIAILITVLIAELVPAMRQYSSFIYFAIPVGIFRAITPYWYFQGLERMRLVAALNISANLCAAALIVSIVHRPSQATTPLVVRAVASLAITFFALLTAYKNLHFSGFNFKTALSALRNGFSVFLFKSAVSLYTAGNVLLMGVFAPASAVAWYAGAERIMRAATALFGPVTQAFFPRISNLLTNDFKQAKSVATTSVRLTTAAGLLMGVVMLFGAPLLVRILLGANYGPAVPVLRCMSLLPPLIGASTVLGIQWMLPLRLDASYTRIILAGGLLNIVSAVLLTPKFQALGIVASVTAAEVTVLLGVVGLLRRKGLAPWSSNLPTPIDLLPTLQ